MEINRLVMNLLQAPSRRSESFCSFDNRMSVSTPTADDPIEKRVCGPISAVCEVKPGDPRIHVALRRVKRPQMVVDHMQNEVGLITHWPRGKLTDDLFDTAGSNVGVGLVRDVDGRTGNLGIVATTEDDV